ncbi:uncharacterized protein RSE6_14075 [Rhynchosporium secalis]|uniref:Uncharacterized protein n=1 Tax=Rhynchosporium secalis TaxID=38038 RepID=A0A1E1MV56_RHYSE|nr:uncharacterized protein RSE6_14075 [Rhynchosporium secalis]
MKKVSKGERVKAKKNRQKMLTKSSVRPGQGYARVVISQSDASGEPTLFCSYEGKEDH